jgi:hypothetical protein
MPCMQENKKGQHNYCKNYWFMVNEKGKERKIVNGSKVKIYFLDWMCYNVLTWYWYS